MKIETFHGKLTSQGIPISIEALTKYLAELGLEDVPQGMVNDLTNDLKKDYVTALELANQGSASLSTDAIATQSPSHSSEPAPEVIDIPWEAQQAIASGADIMRANLARYVEQQESELQETTDLLVKYNRTLEARLWTGVGQQLKTQPSSFDIAKANSEGWDKLKSSLKTAIANVNDFAGVKGDVA